MAEQASQFLSGLVLNAVTWGLGLMSLLLLDHTVGRRWRADRSDRLMAEALQMARVAGDPTEPEMARALATKRLDALGYTAAWLEAQRAEAREAGEAVFQGSAIPAAEGMAISSDASALNRALRFMEFAFERARQEAKPHEDTSIRIALVMATMAVAFGVLGVIATLRVLAN